MNNRSSVPLAALLIQGGRRGKIYVTDCGVVEGAAALV